jgi:hypothetical protein
VAGQQISRRRILATTSATALLAGLPGHAAAAGQPGTAPTGGNDTVVVGPADPRYPVGFQKSVTGSDQQFYAACSYSLIRPPRSRCRLIRGELRFATG